MTTRCINCGLNLRKIREGTAFDLEDNAQQLLREWISPVVLSQEHALCRECNNLVTSLWSRRPLESGMRREFGHRHVCISCGASLLSKRGPILVTTLQPQIRSKIETWAQEYAESHLNHVCRSCTQRAARALSHQPSRRSLARQDSEETDSEENDDEAEFGGTSVALTSLKYVNVARSTPANTSNKAAHRFQVKTLSLPNYRRIQAGAHCIFLHCRRDSVCVQLQLRQKFLTAHHIYIPTDARICHHHMDIMPEPATLGKTLDTFTGDEISDMMFLIKKYRPIDFSDIEAMDAQLRMLWLGVSWEEFRNLLEQTPGLSNVKDAKLLLTIYLTQRRTGENAEVLASLFQMPRDEFERNLQIIRNYFEIKSESI